MFQLNLRLLIGKQLFENYTFSKAQAAAIWVCDFLKYSKHKKENYIFGNTDTKDFLSKNYVNVPIKLRSPSV